MRDVSIELIPNFLIGHATNEDAATGCTVIVALKGACGGVDIRGGAPATRETDLLKPENSVSVVHAVVLSGGSAYGLAAASGVAEELESKGIGLDTGPALVPIVVGASLFDLDLQDSLERPDASYGIRAVEDAFHNKFSAPDHGNVGAGTGASVAKILGTEFAVKSGLGYAAYEHNGLYVGAVVALNALGDIYDTSTNTKLAGPLLEDGFMGDTAEILLNKTAGDPMPLDLTNTTLGCIITNAKLDKSQCTKLAQMSHDGYARAIRPCHSSFDGDSIFVLASGEKDAQFEAVSMLAQKSVEKAILDAITSAESAFGLKSYKD